MNNEQQKDTFQFPPIVEIYYEFCVWLLLKVSKFQKDQKYILGTRLQNNTLDVLEHVQKSCKLILINKNKT